MSLQICVISGSQRKNSNSLKVSKLVQNHFKNNPEYSEPSLVNLERQELPLWDDSMWKPESKLQNIWKPYGDLLSASDGVVIVTPEWSGMVPAALKNFFLYCSGEQLAHKPGLIISISSGMGGSYPVQELRSSSYKNTRINYVPDHVIIRHVGQFLSEFEDPKSEAINSLKKRFFYNLDILGVYAKSFRDIRKSPLINLKEFPFGP